MRKNLIFVALVAVLLTMAVSCQKENLVEPQSTVTDDSTVRTVLYAVDGVEHIVTIHNDEEWSVFIRSMVSLAEEGHSVRIADESASVRQYAAKDTQIYTTKDPDDAAAWTAKMVADHYTVDVLFENGVYTCIAYK